MKKIKSFLSVMLAIMLVSVFAANLTVSAASSKNLNTTMQKQVTPYFCGVASLQSVLWNEYERFSGTGVASNVTKAAKKAIISNQYLVAANIKSHSGYDVIKNTQTPWFIGSKDSQASDTNYNPLCKTLNEMTNCKWNIFGRYTNTGKFESSTVKSKIVNSINKGHCVLANGASSKISYKVIINNKNVDYPKTSGHWVVVTGYENNGNTLIIADPAAKSPALGSSWQNLSTTYKVSLSEFTKYIGNGSHGIVYAQ